LIMKHRNGDKSVIKYTDCSKPGGRGEYCAGALEIMRGKYRRQLYGDQIIEHLMAEVCALMRGSVRSY